MDFPQILAKYRAGATSESDKGAKFEKLMVNFLKTYQIYDQRFERVWRWRDFPFRDEISCRDVGIDLVAKTPEGDYWAVQCKCYQEGAHINKHTLDSFLGPSGRTFKDDSGRQLVFTNRLWISTTNDWTSEAEAELRNQTIPCARISLSDLENARVDWEKLDQGLFGNQARLAGRKTLPHQTEAIEACAKGFKTHDRGRLILACGTGKTFTALKIAERETDGQGLILFLAPSIALIGQSLREWAGDAAKPFQAICVCSDPGVSRSKNKNPLDEDMAGVEDLALPATTDVATIAARLNEAGSRHPGRMRVIFSTYQSIDRVAEALKRTKMTVDLIVCDEAHRTTGVTLADEDESHFVKVHDNGFIKAHKRLYMTATPRVFGEKAKEKAEGASIALCSMDDETLYGPEFHHLGFGEAVDRNLLSDYKVLILTVRRGYVPAKDDDGKDIKEVDADMVTRLIGCLNALSKNLDNEGEFLRSVDPGQMHRAVAFCRTILKSKEITSAFNRLKATFGDRLKPPEGHELVDVVADHIDGGMGSSARDAKMAWLKAQTENPNECRVLDNVKCLSEGVDVPSLDAVMFLSAKNSQIDIVQSVGRVMRKAEGKKFGYAIIPVLIPNHVDPKEVLDDHQNFKVVWYVLNALKSHDDRFTSIINQIQFNEPGDDPDPDRERKHRRSDQIIVDGIEPFDLLAEARKIDFVLHEAIYARLVKKVGSRQDMSDWAADVAKIADGFKGRITKVVNRKGPHKEEFDKFLQGLRQTLNPSVDAAEAIEMLAQHLISKPVFTALFANYAFVKHNPVSQSLEAMIDVLDDQGLEADRAGHEKLDRFFHNVQEQVAGIDNPAGKQKIMDRLYDHFFKLAMPKAVDKLGIVYTPVEIVDFIVHSVAETLKREFGRSISDENVHILDPFAGTGTFVSRLIQSGLLGDSLERKYKSEIHANEIVLLAYYIANVSIESAYHTAMGANAPYRQFNGICLTDTFQLYETRTGDMFAKERLKKNTQRVRDQEKAPIQIIFGNPPFSAGQRSANDNSKNQSYPALEKTIVMTYASKSSAQNKNALYDSYIKAFRWSSDRLGRDGGIIAFVSNSGWLDGNAMDGMRKCLSDEFSKIYVFNLRGNCRTSGELRRKEAGNIFGLGSRTPIAITVLVKKPELQGPAEIYHYDIGDYLSREEKLAVVAEKHDIYNEGLAWERIEPNAAGDWINQRDKNFIEFVLVGDKNDKNNFKTIFSPLYANGIKTNADQWMYNFSNLSLTENINRYVSIYNDSVDDYHNKFKQLSFDNYIQSQSNIIKWHSGIIPKAIKGIKGNFCSSEICIGLYRPFNKMNIFNNGFFVQRVSLLPSLFPTKHHENLVICLSGIGVTKEFSTIITDVIPDLELAGKSQCFPRYYYNEEESKKKATLFKSGQSIDGYTRHDALTDWILQECKTKYGPKANITKDDIFWYVYGLLHSEDYRTAFSADLKKSLPRLPLVDKTRDFKAFASAGKKLAEIHLGYETNVKPYAGVTITGLEKGNFSVDKIRFVDKDDKSAIQFNGSIRISGIPLEAYDYVVNGRSPIEWVMERYQIKVDKDSGIKNDPNDWGKEHGQPRYIFDLILKLITVSLETNKIVRGLPELTF